MWGHPIWTSQNWGCVWDTINYEFYSSVGWHARQLFWKNIRKVTNHRNIFKIMKWKHIQRIIWFLELGEVYLIVWPDGWVSLTDLALQSRTTFCLDNQSIPRITSMSEDLRAINDARNTKPSIATSLS